MGKVYTGLNQELSQFIAAQHLFFVATAPLGREGHVNLSPKGHDTFRVIDPKTVAYLDFTGSGIETVSHLRENGRIVILFCAFEGPPKILRLHGRGEAILSADPRFEELANLFPSFSSFAGVRAAIRVSLERISDSCGYGIPLYRYEGERTQLQDWARGKGPEGLARYRAENNRVSIDGMAGLDGKDTLAG